MYNKQDQELMNKYRDYYGEGWSLVDCRAMTWPFYKVEVSYRYSEDVSLPIVEEFVLKAIDTGYIQSVNCLGQFLGLESAIIDSVLADLHQKSIVELTPCLSLSEKGKLLLEKQVRRVFKEGEKKLYMDGVSGKCQSFYIRNSKNREGAIKPAIIYPRPETLEEHYRTLYEFIREEIEEKQPINKDMNNEQSKNVHLDEIIGFKGSAQRLYVDRLVLFYKCEDSDEGKFLVLTDGQKDVEATSVLEERMKEGKSGFDIKKKANEQQLSVSKDSTGQPQRKIMNWSDIKKCPETTVIEMQDHPVILKLALQGATSHIIINSPWIRDDVVDNEFKQNLESALCRGVNILIVYGMATNNKHQNKPDISKKAKDFFERLKKSYDKGFCLQKSEGNHAKVLICDEKFMVISSYNWLSFPGEKTNSVRIETGTIIKNCDEIDKKAESLIGHMCRSER